MKILSFKSFSMNNIHTTLRKGNIFLGLLFGGVILYLFVLQLNEYSALKQLPWQVEKFEASDTTVQILKHKTAWLLKVEQQNTDKTLAIFKCDSYLNQICLRFASGKIQLQQVSLFVAYISSEHKQYAAVRLKQIVYTDENTQRQVFNRHYIAPNHPRNIFKQEIIFTALCILNLFYLIFISTQMKKSPQFPVAFKSFLRLGLLIHTLVLAYIFIKAIY